MDAATASGIMITLIPIAKGMITDISTTSTTLTIMRCQQIDALTVARAGGGDPFQLNISILKVKSNAFQKKINLHQKRRVLESLDD